MCKKLTVVLFMCVIIQACDNESLEKRQAKSVSFNKSDFYKFYAKFDILTDSYMLLKHYNQCNANKNLKLTYFEKNRSYNYLEYDNKEILINHLSKEYGPNGSIYAFHYSEFDALKSNVRKKIFIYKKFNSLDVKPSISFGNNSTVHIDAPDPSSIPKLLTAENLISKGYNLNYIRYIFEFNNAPETGKVDVIIFKYFKGYYYKCQTDRCKNKATNLRGEIEHYYNSRNQVIRTSNNYYERIPWPEKIKKEEIHYKYNRQGFIDSETVYISKKNSKPVLSYKKNYSYLSNGYETEIVNYKKTHQSKPGPIKHKYVVEIKTGDIDYPVIVNRYSVDAGKKELIESFRFSSCK